MKTSRFINQFKTGLLVLTTLLTTNTFFSSCESEEVTEESVVGTYTNLTDNSNTEITIQETSDGYSFKCYFDDNRNDQSVSYTWKGKFKNIPQDNVYDGSTNIGTVKFSKGEVTFKALTQREDTYKAYSDDLADLFKSRAKEKNDSTAIQNDSIK